MFEEAKKIIENFFFPVKCVNCSQEGEFLCDKCSTLIEKLKRSSCIICGKGNLESMICHTCGERTSLDGLFVLGEYKDYTLKKLIWDLKYNFIKEHAEVLANLLHKDLGEIIERDKTIITAVPLHKNRLRYRGFNQSELIARHLAGKTGISFHETLVRSKNTESQIMLTRFERQNNIRNAFSLSENVSGKNIYIIDDVITTGATLAECSKVLKEGGANTVKGVVLARD